MHLLKQDSNGELVMEKFRDDDNTKVPAYVILSHTWGAEKNEVTFIDIKEGTWRDKPGSAKLDFCARQAPKDGYIYFWIDSCCIDNTNLPELEEAIRLMFRWYKEAKRCYVYLSDVPPPSVDPAWESAFRQSRWFTRGWTLQELLAPQMVDFFSMKNEKNENEKLGSKDGLEQQIHEITGIPVQALQTNDLSQFSPHERLLWAINRNTSKQEDKAYCLLGIFGISMGLRYGERDMAWKRLIDKVNKMPDSDVKQDAQSEGKVEADEIEGDKNSECTKRHLSSSHLPLEAPSSYIEQELQLEVNQGTDESALEYSEAGEIESDLDQDRHLLSSLSRKHWLLYIVITVMFALLITWAWNSLPSPLHPRPPPSLPPTLPIFAIIGRTGVGKSTFIQALGGLDSNSRPPLISDELEPCTKNITFYKFSIHDTQAYIIDTPGFGDVNMSDTKVMMNLFNALNELSLEDRKIRLIYLYDISLSKFDIEAHKNLAYFETLVGLDNAESVALVTGKWRSDPTEEDTRVQLIREKGLTEKYWKAMLEVGTKYERHDGSSESALFIVQRLLQKPVMLKREPGWVRERLKIIEEQEKTKRMAEEMMPKSREQQPKNEKQPFYSAWNPQTWLILKLMWTILRVLAVGVQGIFAIGLTQKFQTLPFVGRIVWGLFCVSFPFLIVLFVYRWLYISHMALLSFDCLLLLIVKDLFTQPVPPREKVFWLAFYVFGFAFNADMYYHWPHNASMYFW